VLVVVNVVLPACVIVLNVSCAGVRPVVVSTGTTTTGPPTEVFITEIETVSVTVIVSVSVTGTFIVVEPEIPLSVAVIVVAPPDTAVAIPCVPEALLIVATVVVDDDHTAAVVMLAVVPSE
jgi:hypothetical protein